MNRLLPVRVWAFAAAACGGFAAHAAACPGEPASYGGFRVAQVHVTSPLGFVPAVGGILNRAKPSLPVQPGGAFDAERYSAGTSILAAAVRNAMGGATRVRVVAVTGELTNCVEHSLEVTYHVFAFNFPRSAAALVEVRDNEIERPAAAAAASNTQTNYSLVPLFGYDSTRHGFGGVRGTLAAKGAGFDTAGFSATGSKAGTEIDGGMTGVRQPSRRFMDTVEYALRYTRSDLPSGQTPIREALLHARLIGQTEAAPAGALTGRYGLAIAGGNQQTGFAGGAQARASSALGLLQTALGFTTRFGGQSAAVSYALTLGSAEASPRLDYTRQIIDASWSGTAAWLAWLPQAIRGHYPLAYQLRVGAGRIDGNGPVPVAERFFGGGTVGQFFPGAGWDIANGPSIRSMPRNGLAGEGMGADRFVSVNLTVAPTVWALPLVPWSVLRDPQFHTAKDFAINSAKRFQKLFYEGQQPAAKAASRDLEVFRPVLSETGSFLVELRPVLPAELQSSFDRTERAYQSAGRAIEAARADPALLAAIRGNVQRLITSLETLSGALAALPGKRSKAGDLAAALKDGAGRLQADIKAIDEKDAQARADRDFASVLPVLNTFTNELNGIAVSPVGIFDMARVHPDPSGMHYAIGGGVRFTLLNLSLTVGWARDPHPLPQFRRNNGTIFAGLEIAGLFQ